MFKQGIPADGSIEIRIIKNGNLNTEGPPDFRVNAPMTEGYVIGRSDGNGSYSPDIDLFDHAAQDLGVSRRHAVLVHHRGLVNIVDLDSVNGTFMNGKRLSPHLPYAFNPGDRLSLANLEMVVMQAE